MIYNAIIKVLQFIIW